MSRRIIIVGAAGLAAALAILAENGIAVLDSDRVELASDRDQLAALAGAVRTIEMGRELANICPEPYVHRDDWTAHPCPPYLQRAPQGHHAPRLRQAPGSYG